VRAYVGEGGGWSAGLARTLGEQSGTQEREAQEWLRVAQVWHEPEAAARQEGSGGGGPDLALWVGAGEGNRTLMTSLEGWGSTIELRPRARRPISVE
jgi:hypothetical protein